MPFTTVQPRKLVSQLFLRDQNNFYENRQIGTLAAAAASATYPIGRLLYRVKGVADAAWTPVTDATAQVVVANELAVLSGDKLQIFADVVHATGTASNIIYFSDRVSMDKAEFLAVNPAITTDAQIAAVETLLQRQQIVFHERAPTYTSVYEA